MAHVIETHGPGAASVFARKDAWHKLGRTLTTPENGRGLDSGFS
jgi:hypothetical protein